MYDRLLSWSGSGIWNCVVPSVDNTFPLHTKPIVIIGVVLVLIDVDWSIEPRLVVAVRCHAFLELLFNLKENTFFRVICQPGNHCFVITNLILNQISSQETGDGMLLEKKVDLFEREQFPCHAHLVVLPVLRRVTLGYFCQLCLANEHERIQRNQTARNHSEQNVKMEHILEFGPHESGGLNSHCVAMAGPAWC